MDNLKTYIDLMAKVCIIWKRDGHIETEETKDLLAQIAVLWEKLDDEEKTYADEQTLRTRLYMGV